MASLTTVGFGDYCPKTPLGMVFGAMCTVTGVLMIDLPMPIIVENFANYYNHLQAHSKFPKKLRRKVLPIEIPRHKNLQTHHHHQHHNHHTIQHSVNSSAAIALITSKINHSEIKKSSIGSTVVIRDAKKMSKSQMEHAL